MTQVKLKRHTTLEGRFILTVRRADGSIRKRLSFKNLITDAGLDRVGSASGNKLFIRAQVGTGSTTPANSDTTLAAFLTGNSALNASTPTQQTTTLPYYAQWSSTWRFATGVAAGNLTEVGMSWAATNVTGSLFSRALILDSGGSPTTLTVLSSETLDVTYLFRMYAPAADAVANVTISGTVYSVTARPLNVGQWAAAATGNAGVWAGQTNHNYTVTNGALVAMAGVTFPTGTASSSITSTPGAYTAGTFTLTHAISAPLASWNLTGGITVMYDSASSLYNALPPFQWGFSPAIAKTASNALTLTLTYTWSRH